MTSSRTLRPALTLLVVGLGCGLGFSPRPAHAQDIPEVIKGLAQLCEATPRAKGLLTLGTALEGADAVAEVTRAAGRGEVALVQIIDGRPVVLGLVPEEGVETLAAMRMQSLAPVAYGDAQMQLFMQLGALTWDPRLARARTFLQMPENRNKAFLLAGHAHEGVAMRGDGSLLHFQVTEGKTLVSRYDYVKQATHTTVRPATPNDVGPHTLTDAERNIARINEILDRYNQNGEIRDMDRPRLIEPGKGYDETWFPE